MENDLKMFSFLPEAQLKLKLLFLFKSDMKLLKKLFSSVKELKKPQSWRQQTLFASYVAKRVHDAFGCLKETVILAFADLMLMSEPHLVSNSRTHKNLEAAGNR